MNNKCYSTNNEDFSYNELDDAIRDALDDPEIEVGSVVTVYEGDAARFKAGDFTGWNLDNITNAACDESEYAEDYLSGITKEQEAELDDMVEAAVNAWADKHGLHPTFYRVKNVKEVQARYVGDNEYELLSDYDPADHDLFQCTECKKYFDNDDSIELKGDLYCTSCAATVYGPKSPQ